VNQSYVNKLNLKIDPIIKYKDKLEFKKKEDRDKNSIHENEKKS